tara:strand:+ start:195 stop:746 length:552 start_codon:yes stop_codon:yes gene_type:complete
MTTIYKTCLWVFIFTITSCGIYSFEGSTLHPDVHNLQINNFTNKSGNNNPILIQTIEEEIKNIFSEKSKLNISSYGDIIIEGEIEEYKITPISVSSGEIATLNRLNIKINVKCNNKIENESSFEKTFNRYVDYESNKDLNTHDLQFAEENSITDPNMSLEEMIIFKICKQICEDIYYQTVSNW